jgi:hypothetical protein
VSKRDQTLEWESRWALPVALATFVAVALIFASLLSSTVSGDGDAEVLRSIHEHSGSVARAGLMQGLGFALLAVPLFYLFRAASARSDRVLPLLVGLVVITPVFLGLSAGLVSISRGEAADQFLAGDAKSTLTAKEAASDCRSELDDKGAKEFSEEFGPVSEGANPQERCVQTKIEDDEASNAISESSLASVVSGLGLAGGLGFVFALFYTCLWAMRTGMLTRFWGSLGMALGVAALLSLVVFTLVWFLYIGFLVIGRIPGGRPPAWAAGEAIPWPTPGEKAAAELQPADSSAPVVGEPEGSQASPGERRKRKQRD